MKLDSTIKTHTHMCIHMLLLSFDSLKKFIVGFFGAIPLIWNLKPASGERK